MFSEVQSYADSVSGEVFQHSSQNVPPLKEAYWHKDLFWLFREQDEHLRLPKLESTLMYTNDHKGDPAGVESLAHQDLAHFCSFLY